MPAVKKENALKAFIVSLFFPVFYWLLIQAVPFVVGIVYGISYAMGHAQEVKANTQELAQNITKMMNDNALFFTLIAVVIFFLSSFFILRGKHQKFLRRIQFNPVPGRIYALVAVLGAAQGFAGGLFSFILPKSWIDAYVNMVTSQFEARGLVMAILVTGLIVPIAEETAFRGLMMTRLQGRMAAWLVVALPALAFTAAHAAGSVAQAIAVVPTAVILGLTFWWTKSIRATILIHIVNNVLSSLIGMVPALSTFDVNSTSPLNLIVSLFGLAVTVAALVLLYRRRQKGAAGPLPEVCI